MAPSQYSKHFFVQEAKNNSWSNMLRYIPDGAKVLDVGCSTGNFGAALEELKHCTVVGIDISEPDIIEASTKISEAYVLDISSADVIEKLGRYDVIVFADVLEHLVQPRDALRAAHTLLNEGGIVVYSIPNMGHLSVRLDLLDGRFPYTELGLLDRTHLHYYDREEVQDVFSSAGFTIAEESPTVSGYPDEWIAQRLAAMGLTPQPSFFDLLKVTEAHVYQFVGVAVPSGESPHAPGPSRDEITPPDELLGWANDVVAENDRLKAEIAQLEPQVEMLELRIQAFRSHPIRGLVRVVFRRLRRVVKRLPGSS